MKQFKPIILTSIIAAILLLISSSWVLEFEYAFLAYLILAGCFLVWVQKEEKTSKFLGRLVLGSGLFGVLAWFLIFLRMYVSSRFLYDAPLPFKELWDMDYLMMGVIFMFVSFLGGLVGVVLKGFYNLYKIKLDKIIILVGPLAVLFSSLAIYRIKLGGTIMSALHGWPYPFWVHQINDIVDDLAIDRWIFSPGSMCHYLIFNYLVFLVIFVLAYFLINYLNRKLRNQKINTTLFLFGLLVLTVLLIVSFLPAKKSYIRRQIAQGQDCDRDVDCVIIANRSPFSCAVVTNTASADRILNLINSYPSAGELQCGGNEKASCIQRRCRVSIDQTSSEMYWSMLNDAIKDCRVESIEQAHSLDVRAVLKNGTVLNTKEPNIDDVFDIVDQYKGKCGEIIMITE